METNPIDFTPYLTDSRGARAGLRTDPGTAIAAIPDGARILVGSACTTPLGLLAEMAAERDRWRRIEIVAGQLWVKMPVLDYAGEPFHFTSLQPSEFLAAASNGGVAEVIPTRYSDIPRLLEASGPRPADVVLVQVSAPGPGGRFSLGISVAALIDVVRSAPLVIAQVNPKMPYTFGAGELRRDEIDFLVEIEEPLTELQPAARTEEATTIASRVVELIPDEATIQFGVGAVPETVIAMLNSRRDIGIHSGMISDPVVDLVECGALTNAAKSFDRGVMVAGEVMGTRRLFDWIHLNPLVQMAPASYTHGIPTVARCRRFVSVQSALQVALDGSINAESIGERQVSGTGGQPDYAAGAAAAAGGIAIHAMPSTAAGGKASRIVRQLDAGAIVTTPRYLADRIVTEVGVAALKGRSVGERRELLAAVAHPTFRDELLA